VDVHPHLRHVLQAHFLVAPCVREDGVLRPRRAVEGPFELQRLCIDQTHLAIVLSCQKEFGTEESRLARMRSLGRGWPLGRVAQSEVYGWRKML
jgi:hypothetical protein